VGAVLRRPLLAIALAPMLLAPAAALAEIEPQRGIAGVRMGMTEPEVRAVLGPPVRAKGYRHELGPFRTLFYRGLGVTLRARGGPPFRVTSVQATGREQRTAEGVGVGSPERRVRATLPRARCRTELGLRACVLGVLRPGRKATAFVIRRGRVVRVTVGIVID
jgi:hypothetical protein